jgi:intergrase/recombinase
MELWRDFEVWLLKTHRPKNAKELFRYAQRFAYILEKPGLASQLLMLTKDVRRLAMSSLSNLSKYLGIYEQWKQTIRNFGLKWESTSCLEAFLSILNSDVNETETWLKQVIQKLPKEYSTVLVFDALTGLRPNEAVMSCRLITELSEKKILDRYSDKDLLMLQHFKFPELFLRRSKNAYISFITPQLLNIVLETKPKVKYTALDTKIGRLGFPIKTKQLRKLHATTLRTYLPQELIDLLQGRISQTVFIKFYYRPLLEDIKDKTLKAIQPIEKELIEIIRHG